MNETDSPVWGKKMKWTRIFDDNKKIKIKN